MQPGLKENSKANNDACNHSYVLHVAITIANSTAIHPIILTLQ